MFGWLKGLFKASPASQGDDLLHEPASAPSASQPPAADAKAEADAPSMFDRLILDGLPDNERRLAQSVLDDARNGTIELPTLPDLALAVRRAVNDPEASIEKLSRLIQADMLITAKVIQVANSAVFGGYSQVATLQEAITRLGLQHTRDVVTSLAMKQMFTSDRPDLERRMRELWLDSTRVAAISAVLSRFAPGLGSERAMLAGLMHDIGVLTIIQYVSKDQENQYSDTEVNSAIHHLRGILGSTVLQHWNFEVELAQVPMAMTDIEEHIPGPITYSDVVRVAKLHALFGSDELANYPPLPELSAFKKFGLSLEGPDKSIDALREAKADIDAVRQTLNI